MEAFDRARGRAREDDRLLQGVAPIHWKSKFRTAVEEAILSPLMDVGAQRYARLHLPRYVTALQMLEGIARPEMAVMDIASMGTILPALRNVLRLQNVTATGPVQQTTLRLATPGGEMSCPYLQFDLEDPFPIASETVDLVIFTEVLEHLTRDPMHTLGEISRIVKPGGRLLLSTPNCTSVRSVINAIRGRHPYQWAPFSKAGDRDRHNREYTPTEVRRALECAGFQVERLLTSNEAYGAQRRALVRGVIWIMERALALMSLVPPGMRGESIFVLARKVGGVTNRFPDFLYYESARG